MDISCASCSEGWDHHHIRFDEIYETDLSDDVKKNWDGKLTPTIKKAFEKLGWKFIGNSIYAIVQCPACKDTPNMDKSKIKQRIAMKQALVDVLGGDDDGLISEINDLDENGYFGD